MEAREFLEERLQVLIGWLRIEHLGRKVRVCCSEAMAARMSESSVLGRQRAIKRLKSSVTLCWRSHFRELSCLAAVIV
jgi:hypothetical protein